MQRFHPLATTLLAAASLYAFACEKTTDTSSTPPDSTMASDDSSSMPGDTPSEATPDEGGAETTPPPEPKKELAENDRNFVETAAKAGMAEVELSNMALTKAKKQTIKDFAQKMVDQHGKANEELTALASSKGATMPTAIDQPEQAKKDELDKLTGSKFEKRYVQIMLDDHKKAVALFKDWSQSGTDPELKDWAAKTLPALEEHLAHVEHLKSGKAYKPKNEGQAAAPSEGTPADPKAESKTGAKAKAGSKPTSSTKTSATAPGT